MQGWVVLRKVFRGAGLFAAAPACVLALLACAGSSAAGEPPGQPPAPPAAPGPPAPPASPAPPVSPAATTAPKAPAPPAQERFPGRVVYQSAGEKGKDIFLLDAGTGKAKLLTISQGNDVEPSFSPDGKKIAYVCGVSDKRADLCVMDADGAGSTRVTNREGAVGAPRWSPDGTTIVFHAFWGGRWVRLYSVRPDGTGLESIDVGPRNALWPDVSPDGRKIAFVSDRDGNDEIYVAALADRQAVRITRDTARDRFPRWSPDGKRILFNSSRDGCCRLYTMTADGKDVKPATEAGNLDGAGDWAGGGDWIVLAARRDVADDTASLGALKIDGTARTDLLKGISSEEAFPDWTP